MNDANACSGEMIERLQEAQAKLFEVIEELEQIAHMTDDRHAEAYLVDHLKILASSDHGFLSRDFNIDRWIDQIRREEEEENDERHRGEWPDES